MRQRLAILAAIGLAVPERAPAGTAPQPHEADGITHVIAWFPPYLARPRRRPPGKPCTAGWWDLQEVTAYDAGEPPPGGDWSWDGPRDEDSLRLANWAALALGHPVTVERFTVDIRPGRLPVRRWRPEPACYVRPAS